MRTITPVVLTASAALTLPVIACAKSVETRLAPARQVPDAVRATVLERVPAGYVPAGRGEGVPEFWVRPGFKVSVVAEGFGEARFMQFDDKGRLFVSQPGKGTIKVFRLANGRYEAIGDYVTGYRSVHGLDFKDGWLWFTTSGAIYKARDTKGNGVADEVVTVLNDLPSGGHWWRSILVTNDGFFTSIGDSGNITDLTASDREKIWKYSPDGKTKTLWVGGIRNTEKLRFKPGTQQLYGADHGSDDFGRTLGERQGKNQPVTDDNPPCEFNKYVQGAFYGHPFIVGNGVPRLEFTTKSDILDIAKKSTNPAWCLGPHWAPNGWTFLAGSKLGVDMKGDVLVANHGSWNRTVPGGYRVERIIFDKVTNEPIGGQMIVSTQGANGQILGRPVDVVEAPDGTVLFSDDGSNRIYRLEKTR